MCVPATIVIGKAWLSCPTTVSFARCAGVHAGHPKAAQGEIGCAGVDVVENAGPRVARSVRNGEVPFGEEPGDVRDVLRKVVQTVRVAETEMLSIGCSSGSDAVLVVRSRRRRRGSRRRRGCGAGP